MKNETTTITATPIVHFNGDRITCLYEARLRADQAAAEVARGQGDIAFWDARMVLRWLATAYPELISANARGSS